MTGIYKITNTVNNKHYIGQSKNIFTRWKSHTRALNENSNESVIRMAFAKYGLRQQVSKSGIYGVFKFEIIEICDESKLLEREQYYIRRYKPEYNVAQSEPSEYFHTTNQKANQWFIQYHSYEKRGYFPNYSGPEDDNLDTFSLDSGIYSKKRLCKDMLHANILVILGCKPGKCDQMKYYLWSTTQVESIEYVNFSDFKNYILIGIERLFEYPILLNSKIGFETFRKKNGNFAYGLQRADTNDFFNDEIVPYIQNNLQKAPSNYKQYLTEFCDRENEKYQNDCGASKSI